MEIIMFSDIVESNGKTIRENNLEIKHRLKVGDRVSIKDNVCTFVCHLDRDCDGTPLYSLCGRAALKELQRNASLYDSILWRIENQVCLGWNYDSLRIGWGWDESGGPF